MKKLFNYSYLVLLCFIAFACSKEEGAIDPTAPLSATSTENVAASLDGYGIGCISYSDHKWSFPVYGPGGGKANAGRGLSHLNLELVDCYGKTICLEKGDIIHAKIVIGSKVYKAGELDANGNGFKLEYSDGSCTPPGVVEKCIVKFEMIGKMDDILKTSSATFYFTLANGGIISGANILVKTGNGCFREHIKTCKDYCKKPPVTVCSYSQGRYFNPGNDGKNWPAGVETVTVGGVTLTRGVDTLPATTAERRALFQAATLILSAQEQGIALNTYINSLPESVRNAYNCIVTYYQNTNVAPTCDLQNAAGTIGDWISLNHCDYK